MICLPLTPPCPLPLTPPPSTPPPLPQDAGFVPDRVTLAAGGTLTWAASAGEPARHPLVLMTAAGVAVDGVVVAPGEAVSR